MAERAGFELRDHLLIALNLPGEGRGGGELFNGAGKTDILIREGDRNVFIAECEFWRGPKAATAALTQLFGYLVWRDSKSALIIFITTKEPTATIANLDVTIGADERNILTSRGGAEATRVDYRIRADDEGRTVSWPGCRSFFRAARRLPRSSRRPLREGTARGRQSQRRSSFGPSPHGSTTILGAQARGSSREKLWLRPLRSSSP